MPSGNEMHCIFVKVVFTINSIKFQGTTPPVGIPIYLTVVGKDL